VLTFTTDALARDMEVVGPIVLELHASSTQPDTDFFVRIADQLPQDEAARKEGRQPASVVVTKGWLRASHREKDEARSKPYRPIYTHRDPQPLQPGRIYAFEIEVLPCSYLFRKGHRLRLEIVNGDSLMTDGFFSHQYMPYKVGRDEIHHSAAHPSRLILPLAPAAR
jgi:putative CocE/NonD family hydrolase